MMSTFFRAVLLTQFVFCNLVANSFAEEKPATDKAGQQAKDVQLPDDPQALMISLNYTGGRLIRKNKSPVLSIFADGTVKVADVRGNMKDVVSKLSKAELQTLLQSIIHENDFFKLDAAKIQNAVREEAKIPQPGPDGVLRPRGFVRIMDSATSIINVHADSKQHEVKYYAIYFYAREFPGVESLQKLNNVSKLLQSEMKYAYAGGRAGAAKMLELANALLKQKYPEAKPFTAEHFTSAAKRADGTRHFRFYRHKPGPDGKPESAIYSLVKIVISTKGGTTTVVQAKLK